MHLLHINVHLLFQVLDIFLEIWKQVAGVRVVDVEPRMTEGLSGIESGPGVLVEHLAHQVLRLRRDLVPVLRRILHLASLVLHQDLMNVGARKGRSAS